LGNDAVVLATGTGGSQPQSRTEMELLIPCSFFVKKKCILKKFYFLRRGLLDLGNKGLEVDYGEKLGK
jgi:hypothetical protein